MCKQRVTRQNQEPSESDSDEESGGHREDEGTEGEADSERTPLLRPSNPGSPSGSPRAYSATTTVTTAQCLASPARCDSPIIGYEGYYSPHEETDSESDDAGEDRHHTDDDTAQLIGRDRVEVWWLEFSSNEITWFNLKRVFLSSRVLLTHCNSFEDLWLAKHLVYLPHLLIVTESFTQ